MLTEPQCKENFYFHISDNIKKIKVNSKPFSYNEEFGVNGRHIPSVIMSNRL